MLENQDLKKDESLSDKETVQQLKKPTLKTYFSYEIVKNVKQGNCLICGKDSQGIFKSSPKMTDGNTSGLKAHLRRHHEKEYNTIFDASDSKLNKSKSQKTLDLVVKVSDFVVF